MSIPRTLLRRAAPREWWWVALPVVVLAIGAYQHRWLTDDGFINLRIVRQMEAGHGPVFNVGERVEAVTSILWLLWLLIADVLLPFRLEHLAAFSGIVLTLAGMTALTVAARRIARGARSGSGAACRSPRPSVTAPCGISPAPAWRPGCSSRGSGCACSC
jgi:arabinofuranosyltransferase